MKDKVTETHVYIYIDYENLFVFDVTYACYNKAMNSKHISYI